MKPLALERVNTNHSSNGNIQNNTFHLVRILNPEENSGNKCNDWVLATDSSTDTRVLKDDKLCPPHILLNQLHQILKDSSLPLSQHNSIGKIFTHNLNGKPSLKLSEIDHEYSVELLIQDLKLKSLGENDDSLFFVRMDRISCKEDGMAEDYNGLGGQTANSGFTAISAKANIDWKITEKLSLPLHLLIPEKHWETLKSSLEHLFGGQVKTKKYKGVRIKDNNLETSSSSNRRYKSKSVSFLKWITTKNARKLVVEGGGKRTRAYSEDDNEDENVEEDEINEEENSEKEKKPISGGKRKFTMKKTKTDGKKQQTGWNSDKVKKIINFSSSDTNEFVKQAVDDEHKTLKEDKQQIKIELKPDPKEEDSSFQYCSGDMIRLKLTVYNFGQNFNDAGNYEVEIDFVENLVCETDTQNACRARRIAKMLKRMVITDLKWEKAVNIIGQHSVICWIPYRIPGLVSEQRSENIGKDEECVDGEDFTMEKLDDKFKVTSFQFELQIRLHEKVTASHEIHHVLAACSCFPLNLKMKNSLKDKETSIYRTGSKVLQISQEENPADVAEEFQETEIKVTAFLSV